MKKILHITPEIGQLVFGGIGSIVNSLYQNKTEYDQFFFCDIWFDDPIDVLKTKLSKDIGVYSFRLISEAIDESDVDVVVFHTFFLFKNYIDNRKNKDKELWTVFHNNPIIEGSYRYTVMEPIDQFNFLYSIYNGNSICISKYEQNLLNNILQTKPSNYLNKVIYNGIKFDDNYNYQYINNRTYGYMGRIEERKGIYHIMQYFNNLDKKLLIAGRTEAKYSETMFNMARANSDNIIPLGWCIKERFKSFLDESAAIIIPSIYEPFGMVFLEAANYMKIIIANKTDSSVEILGEDYPLFFDISNKESFINILNKFESMTNEERVELAIKTKKDLSIRFSISNTIKGYRDL